MHFLGYAEQIISIEKLLSFILEDDRSIVIKTAGKIMMEGLKNKHEPLEDVYCLEYRMQTITGQVKWVKTEISTLLKDKTGTALLTLVQFSELLHNSEKREFRYYYCGKNSSEINITKGRPNIYKRRNFFSPRLKEVAVLIRDGKLNKEIAGILNISISTVETHRKNLMEKTSSHNLAELIKWINNNL
jgi:DNA-binding NarL/FixJ family response regulator